jgi:signal transduction histidine kinase
MAMAAIPNTIERTGTAARGWAGHARVRLVQQAGSYSASKVADVGLAVLVAAANVVAISVASEPQSRSPDALAYVLGVVIGAMLLVRRRWPLAVLIASAALLFLYYSLNYPGIPPAVALAVALYTAVVAGHLRWGWPIAAFFILAGLFVVVIRKHELFLLTLAQMAQQAALLAVVLLLGEVVRNRRRYLDEVRERMQRVEAEREREAARQVAEERLRIARELHDVMAHTITAISVQAGLALDVFDDAPTQAHAALGAIRTASREAMAEIRATIGVLRDVDDGAAPRSPMPTLEQVDRLIAEAQRAGLRATAEVTGDPRPVPAAVDTTAFRIVQESLTNVVRHARANCVTIRIRYEPAALSIDVADNGTGADGSSSAGSRGQPGHRGHGLVGMMERAAALGGWLQAGPRPGGGFLVQAWLPTSAGASEEEPT